MLDFLNKKWDKLMGEIRVYEDLKDNSSENLKIIRELKNEASVIRFAIERARIGVSDDVILYEMKKDRNFYKNVLKFRRK